MARFTIASTPRTFDKTTGQWTDGTALFLRATAWRELANNIAESLTKGMRVVVTGTLRQHNWKTDQGENRSMLGIDVEDIGPSLKFATSKVTRAQRASSGQLAQAAADPGPPQAPLPSAPRRAASAAKSPRSRGARPA